MLLSSFLKINLSIISTHTSMIALYASIDRFASSVLSREKRVGLHLRTETLHRTCCSQVYASFIRVRSRCISLSFVLLYAANKKRIREIRRCFESAINRSRAPNDPGLINPTISRGGRSRVIGKSTQKYFVDFREIIFIDTFRYLFFSSKLEYLTPIMMNGDHVGTPYVILNYSVHLCD